MGSRTTNWLRGNLSSENEQSRLGSGPQENAKNPRNQARRASQLLHKLQTGTGRRLTPGRHHATRRDQAANGQESTQGAADRPRMGRQGRGNRLRHQELDKNLQNSIKNVAREGMAWFPSKMNQQSPKLTVKKIHGSQPPFVSWRKENTGEAQLEAQHQTKPTDHPWDTENENT